MKVIRDTATQPREGSPEDLSRMVTSREPLFQCLNQWDTLCGGRLHLRFTIDFVPGVWWCGWRKREIVFWAKAANLVHTTLIYTLSGIRGVCEVPQREKPLAQRWESDPSRAATMPLRRISTHGGFTWSVRPYVAEVPILQPLEQGQRRVPQIMFCPCLCPIVAHGR
jgi:hypothetical protein